MSIDEKITLIEKTLGLSSGSISLDTILDAEDWWDSLSSMSLMVMLKTSFGRSVDFNRINRLHSVKELLEEMHE